MEFAVQFKFIRFNQWLAFMMSRNAPKIEYKIAAGRGNKNQISDVFQKVTNGKAIRNKSRIVFIGRLERFSTVVLW